MKPPTLCNMAPPPEARLLQEMCHLRLAQLYWMHPQLGANYGFKSYQRPCGDQGFQRPWGQVNRCNFQVGGGECSVAGVFTHQADVSNRSNGRFEGVAGRAVERRDQNCGSVGVGAALEEVTCCVVAAATYRCQLNRPTAGSSAEPKAQRRREVARLSICSRP